MNFSLKNLFSVQNLSFQTRLYHKMYNKNHGENHHGFLAKK